MTKREMNLNIFAGRPNPRVFFQPRIEPWYDMHQRLGDISPRLRGMSLLEFYDDLRVSMRYTHYYTGMPYPIETRHAPEVKIRYTGDGEHACKVVETPFGNLVEESQLTSDKAWRTVRFPVATEADLKALGWLCARTTHHFNREAFLKGAANLGDRGEPQFWVPKMPYQALAQSWSTLDDLVVALHEIPNVVEDAMKAVDASYDPLYDELRANADVVHIVNFGENVHSALLSPKYFEKYYLPYYEKRSGGLRRDGIYTHVHIDGYFKPLLPYLKDLPFDGLEALTPTPQGDVTLEEMKAAIGDKVLLDGIPALLFMPYHSEEEFEACVRQVIKLFHPRLVLGISDEFPQGASEVMLERVRWVMHLCESTGP